MTDLNLEEIKQQMQHAADLGFVDIDSQGRYTLTGSGKTLIKQELMRPENEDLLDDIMAEDDKLTRFSMFYGLLAGVIEREGL